jgi:hypothetical protein
MQERTRWDGPHVRPATFSGTCGVVGDDGHEIVVLEFSAVDTKPAEPIALGCGLDDLRRLIYMAPQALEHFGDDG